MINSNRSFQVALPQVAKNQKRDEVTLSFLENDFHYGFQVNSLVFYKALKREAIYSLDQNMSLLRPTSLF